MKKIGLIKVLFLIVAVEAFLLSGISVLHQGGWCESAGGFVLIGIVGLFLYGAAAETLRYKRDYRYELWCEKYPKGVPIQIGLLMTERPVIHVWNDETNCLDPYVLTWRVVGEPKTDDLFKVMKFLPLGTVKRGLLEGNVAFYKRSQALVSKMMAEKGYHEIGRAKASLLGLEGLQTI